MFPLVGSRRTLLTHFGLETCMPGRPVYASLVSYGFHTFRALFGITAKVLIGRVLCYGKDLEPEAQP